MTKFLQALMSRSLAWAIAFILGVSATILWVYYIHGNRSRSDYLDLAKVKEEKLASAQKPHVFRVFVPEKVELPDNLVCIKPSASVLVVSVDEERQLTLNDGDIGTLSE